MHSNFSVVVSKDDRHKEKKKNLLETLHKQKNKKTTNPSVLSKISSGFKDAMDDILKKKEADSSTEDGSLKHNFSRRSVAASESKQLSRVFNHPQYKAGTYMTLFQLTAECAARHV